jgi:paraquat-inducible protein B
VITIYFHNAEGIEAGKTHIKYKDVDVGIVKRVKLTPTTSRRSHRADARRRRHRTMLVTDTRFWVVRPRIGAAGVSGSARCLSGPTSRWTPGRNATERTEFQGLDVQPTISADVPGREFTLDADELGSLDIGSPIFLRRVPVGQVLAYEMTPDGQHIRFRIFITAPYDRFVNADSRFWHASGVDVDLDVQGLHVSTQSLQSLLAGGIAVPGPARRRHEPARRGAEHTQFRLFDRRDDALRRADAHGFDYRLLFAASVRGLAVGAPVDFRGLPIGEVTRIAAQVHAGPGNPEPLIAVDVRVYPRRLPTADDRPVEDITLVDQRKRIDPMVAHGFRGQLRSGNLLTGQLYVALDFFPNAPRATIDWKASPPTMPTVPGSLDSLQDSLTHLAQKLDKLPLDTIAEDLHRALTDLDRSVKHADALVQNLDSNVAPEARETLVEARKALLDLRKTLAAVNQTMGPGATQTLNDLSRAAISLRALADYLERHPESLLKGKPEDPK